jgi:hypothetical protein
MFRKKWGFSPLTGCYTGFEHRARPHRHYPVYVRTGRAPSPCRAFYKVFLGRIIPQNGAGKFRMRWANT